MAERVDRDHDDLREVGGQRPSVVARDAHVGAEKRAGGSRPKQHHRIGLHQLELGLHPREARTHLDAIRSARAGAALSVGPAAT